MDQRVLDAATSLLAEGGLDALTVSAVTRRTGIARATVYRRWPTRGELLGATAKAAVGGEPYAMTGDFETDIRQGAEFIRRVFSGDGFVRVLPDLVAAVLGDPPTVDLEDLAPNRPRFAALATEAASASEIDRGLDPDLPLDILLGTAICYVLANRESPPRAYMNQVAEIIVRGTRAKVDRGPTVT